MKLLITGGLGHIGSFFIRSPFVKQYDITIVDNLSTQRYCSLINLRHPIYFMDRNFNTLTESELSSFDVVIHLAAMTDAASSFNCKDDIKKVNVDDTIDLIRKVEAAGVGLFVFPSSTSVYGGDCDVMVEDDDNLDPQSPYAESKIAIEDVLRAGSLNYVIVRFGTIFGTSTGMRFHTAINKFCYQAALGQKITVWRQNYEHFRPYLSLIDAWSAIVHLLDRPYLWNNTYNVITDNYQLSHIISILGNIVSPNSIGIDFVDTPLLNQHSYKASSRKLLNTGWSAIGNLVYAMRATVRLFERIVPAS